MVAFVVSWEFNTCTNQRPLYTHSNTHTHTHSDTYTCTLDYTTLTQTLIGKKAELSGLLGLSIIPCGIGSCATVTEIVRPVLASALPWHDVPVHGDTAVIKASLEVWSPLGDSK